MNLLTANPNEYTHGNPYAILGVLAVFTLIVILIVYKKRK